LGIKAAPAFGGYPFIRQFQVRLLTAPKFLRGLNMIETNIDKLKIISKETSWEEVEKLKLVEKMKMEIRTAWVLGFGLSAIQIGVPLRFAWYIWHGKDKFLINPKLIEGSGSVLHNNEGCLSIPHIRVTTNRFNRIVYLNDGKQFEADQLESVIIQHEIDHMDGLTIFDRTIK
jgi:peptide deformylase